MAVPKRKTSHSKKNKRRSHHALTGPSLTTCPDCGEPTMRHRACSHCGSYRGRKVVEVRAD
jgi:large subunit ribosomal protein L32